MKERLISAGLIIAILLLAIEMEVSAYDVVEYDTGVLYDIECSAYCDSNQTATGTEVREGIAAFAPRYYGYVAVVYYEGELVGIYEIQDTGSVKCGVRTGECLDIWMPTANACYEFGRKTCQVYFVKGQG